MNNNAQNQKVAIVPLFVKKKHVASLWFVPKKFEEPSFTAFKALMQIQAAEDIEIGSSSWVERQQESILLTRIITQQKSYYLWFDGRTSREAIFRKLNAIQQSGVMGAIKVLEKNSRPSDTIDPTG